MKKIDKGFYLSEFLNTLKLQIQDESYAEMEDYKQQIQKITNDIISKEQFIYLKKYIESIFKQYSSILHLNAEQGEDVIKEVLNKIDDLPNINHSISIYEYLPFEMYYSDKAIYDIRVFVSLIKKGFDFNSNEYNLDDYINIKDKEKLIKLIKN